MTSLHCIYKIINPKGFVYIGQTKNFKKRIKCYENIKCFKQHLIFNSINKYGWESHSCKIIANNLSKEDADKEEIKYIAYFKSKNKSLNIRDGGSAFGAGVFVKICQFSLDGVLLNTYDKIKDAALKNNCCQYAIWNSLRQNNYSSGFLWATYEKYKKGFIPKLSKKTSARLHIYQFDLDGNLINEFRSIRQASKYSGLSCASIGNNIHGVIDKLKGFVFSTNKNHVINIKSRYITISCFDNKGDLFKIFDNDRIASEYFNVSRSWINKICKNGGQINGYRLKKNEKIK